MECRLDQQSPSSCGRGPQDKAPRDFGLVCHCRPRGTSKRSGLGNGAWRSRQRAHEIGKLVETRAEEVMQRGNRDDSLPVDAEEFSCGCQPFLEKLVEPLLAVPYFYYSITEIRWSSQVKIDSGGGSSLDTHLVEHRAVFFRCQSGNIQRSDESHCLPPLAAISAAL